MNLKMNPTFRMTTTMETIQTTRRLWQPTLQMSLFGID